MAFRVYLLSDPRDPQKGYVGQTCKLIRSRYWQHVNAAKRGADLPLHRWLRTLLRANQMPLVRILQTCDSPDEANQAEQKWIQVCRMYHMKLYNVTDGGEGTRGDAFAATMREVMARPEVRAHKSAKICESWKDPEHRARRVAGQRKAQNRPELKAHLSRVRSENWAALDSETQIHRLKGARSAGARRKKSGRMAEHWADPEYRDKVSQSLRRAFSSSEAREAMSSRAIEVNARPDVKAKVDAARAATWADPDNRAKRIANMKTAAAKPEERARRSAASKAMWARRRLTEGDA